VCQGLPGVRAVGQRSSILRINVSALLIALAIHASRADEGLSPSSVSLLAARIVAENRMAYFRCSSMRNPAVGDFEPR
jgi:hypothetical protein